MKSPDVGENLYVNVEKYCPFGKIFSLDIHDNLSLQEKSY